MAIPTKNTEQNRIPNATISRKKTTLFNFKKKTSSVSVYIFSAFAESAPIFFTAAA